MSKTKKKTKDAKAFVVLDSVLLSDGASLPGVKLLRPFPPGTGKTAFMLEMARQYGCPVLFIAHASK